MSAFLYAPQVTQTVRRQAEKVGNMASFIDLLKEFEDEVLGERISAIRHNARQGFAKWLDQKAAEHSVHLTGGSHVVGEANSENYVRWQNGDLPEEPASR